MQQSADIENRTAEQVLSDHRAALAEGEIDRDVERNYAADAVVISDAGVDRGREAIRQRLLGIAALFGDVVPVVAAQTVVPLDKATFMARVLFSVATPGIEVADGVDTYIIKNGQIIWQSAHGRPVFHQHRSCRLRHYEAPVLGI